MKIVRLEASGVRGIPRGWPAMEIPERGLVVYGPNGTGKSSLIDAIEFALAGRSTLFADERMGVSWANASPHIMAPDSGSTVHVRSGNSIGAFRAGRPLAPEMAAVAEQVAGRRFVLRRHMLLSLISAAPRDRYAQLEAFLDLGNFKVIESQLRKLLTDLDKPIEASQSEKRHNAALIQRVFGVATGTDLSEEILLTAINSEGRKLAAPSVASLDDLTAIRKKAQEIIGGEGRNERLANLSYLRTALTKLPDTLSFVEEIDQLRAAREAYQTCLAEHHDLVLTDLLIHGRQVISEHHLHECPICEQTIEPSAVLIRLDQRIATDDKLTQTRSALESRQLALSNRLQTAAGQAKEAARAWEETIADRESNRLKAVRDLLNSALTALNSIGADEIDALRPDFLEMSGDHLEDALTVEQLLSNAGDTEQRKTAGAIEVMIRVIENEWVQHERNAKRIRHLLECKTQLEKLLEHTVESRKEAVQAILDDVAAAANRYYSEIHPKEDLGASRLEVRQSVSSSVMLHATFFGTTENPLLHFSESHLDTLGLCYFLALRRREADLHPDYKLLILDDVMHSVDAEHRGRIAALLRRHFSDHQMIISTHDKYFFDRLKIVLGAGGLKYIAIARWSLEEGPLTGDSSSDLDRILSETERVLKSADELAAACGRLFEVLLKHLTERLGVAVPARFSRSYDIGSLWPPLSKKLRRRSQFMTVAGQVVTGIEENGWVRNKIGAHADEVESGVTPAEVHGFADALAHLYRATHCEECGEFISERTNEDWSCECGQLTYS